METSGKLGLQKSSHPGQELKSEFKGKTYFRYPIKTELVKIDSDLDKFIEENGIHHYKDGDIFCIASKVVSICKGFYMKEENLKVTKFATFLVRFVKKWPHDPGFAIPQKIQWALNIVGYPRFIFAMIGGVIMKKVFGKPGYFYILAGHNISTIDGFVPHLYPEPLRGYGFIAPSDSDKISDEIEAKFGMHTAILDGNNVENVVLGMSKSLKERFTKEELLEILKGNPQGQSGNTPMLIVREES